MKTPAFIGLYRVSTDKQSRSGLGLEAQQAAVRSYVASVGGRLVAEFTEVESGAQNFRPQLNAAVVAHRVHRAVIAIARLDRLSRDAALILDLKKQGVRFVDCSSPHDDETMLGIKAVLAADERRKISERTRAALQAAKARGVKLGSPVGLAADVAAKGRELGAAANAERAASVAADLEPVLADLRSQGATTLQQFADGLNRLNIPTARGGIWGVMGVSRVLARLG